MNDPISSSLLVPPVDPRFDHAVGDAAAELTLLEFGSFDCPYCHAAHEIIANLHDRFGERMRYVFRHRPITGDEQARQGAVLAEYARETTGQYWPAHDAFMKIGAPLRAEDRERVAAELGLPPRDGASEAAWQRAEDRVAADIDSARLSGAFVSPTFFINGRRYEGPWDENSLAEAMLGSLGHRMQSAALDFVRWGPSAGLLLLVMLIAAVAAVNSPLGAAFQAWWERPLGVALGNTAFRLSLRDWINDGLLTIFFLVVGLEIKREFTVGRLATRRAAALPFAAAAGGMLAPALIYLAVAPAPFAHGWAIPTTTDTAFAIAVIAVLGTRVPVELRIFLTAAAIVDDLVAIAIVAIFYSGTLDATFIFCAILVTAALGALNHGGVYRPLPYAVLGGLLWICLHGGGLHPTLAGVILAVLTPTRPPANLGALLAQAEAVLKDELRDQRQGVVWHGPSEPALRAMDAVHDRIESPAAKLLRTVEPWSTYFVLPLFALANAGVALSPQLMAGHGRLVLAIGLGLVLGKPLGMLAAAAIAVRSGVAVKSGAYSWPQLTGAATLAGIGFTMSLYIAQKAFPDAADFAAAKIGVFGASLLAAALGTLLLRVARNRESEE